jgi:HD-GYP domain-containing protein (c-di-GMP phosphodiesterase class II)
MKIQTKLIYSTIPLLISALLVSALSSSTLARSAITRLSIEQLGFKSEQLMIYTENQWETLLEYGYDQSDSFRNAAFRAVIAYARTLLIGEGEMVAVLGVNREPWILLNNNNPASVSSETMDLGTLDPGFHRIIFNGEHYSVFVRFFPPLDLTLISGETEATLSAELDTIAGLNAIITGSAAILLILVLIWFSRMLTDPLRSLHHGILTILNSNDFSKRVSISHDDEIGDISRSLNILSGELTRSYSRIKNIAIREAEARIQVADREQEALLVLAKAAEYRDQNTGEHIIRVGLYSRLLAKKLGLSEDDCNILYFAAPLHDVGKIGIPDQILNKPGSLDESEWAIMREHTLIGHRILKGSQSRYLQAGAEIALNHHEHWDGSGYPHGLSGYDIPVFARILSVVDMFDALCSRRPYKGPWSFDDAFAEIQRNKDTFFQAEIVGHFIESKQEIREIYQAHNHELI